MEESTRFALRDRRTTESLTVLPAPTPIPDQLPHEPHLRDYFIIVRKHQWLILAFFLTVVTVTTIASFKMKPVYEAAARVEVDKESQDVLPFQTSQGGYDEYEDTEAYLETQANILRSETLALQTIKTVDLEQYPPYGGVGAGLNFAHSGVTSNRPAILGAFLGNLNVRRVPNTRLIEVRFDAEDPQVAAKVVNAHVENYREANFKSKYNATIDASTWLSSEIEDLRVKMQKSEDARLAYERQNQIWQIDGKQDITTQKLADLSKTVTDAQIDLAQKEALYRMATSGDVDAIPAAQSNPMIQELLRKKSDLDAQYTDALNQYGPNFPKVERLAAQQREVADDLVNARKTLVQTVEQDYQTAGSRADILQARLDAQKTEANDQAERLVQYNILQHDADANKQLYDGLLEKLKEATITAGLQSNNIRVVDPALAPTTPTGPQRTRNVLLSMLVGLVGGIGLAMFREYLNNTVTSPDDVEHLTHLPLLAVVPSFAAPSVRSGEVPRLAEHKSGADLDSRVELLAYAQPKSQISEAFRALRTSLLLSQADHPPQVILVTSALPREGKTTTATNLAVTLAHLGDRTLLIDCDLRKPGIKRALNLPGKEQGLSSYLAGVCSLEDATVVHPMIGNLSALTAGPIPPSPADLLSSHRMRDAIAELRRRFKFIVVDSPPIMAATDAVILSALADGVLLVAQSGQTPKEAFTRTRDLLRGVKADVLGVILNGVDSSSPEYYYSYRYYPYAYGYGYGEDVPKTALFPSGLDDPANPSS